MRFDEFKEVYKWIQKELERDDEVDNRYMIYLTTQVCNSITKGEKK